MSDTIDKIVSDIISDLTDRGGARKIPALIQRLATKGMNIMDLDVRANKPI